MMSCNEITRFHAQLKPVQNYTFLKDPRVFVNNLWGKYADLIVADPRPQADTSAVRTSVIATHCLLHYPVDGLSASAP